MRYLRLQTLGFAVLLATLTAIHCIPTETRADRRRSTTFLAASSQDSWPEWDGVTAHPELTDAHPTTGWPREYGRICVTFTSGASGEHRAIIDGRTDGEDPRPYLSVVNDGRIRFGIQTVGSIAGGEVIPFHTHTACVDRSYGPRTSLYLDGQLIGTSTTLPAWDWHTTARLGSRYGGADPLGGEIKSIQWRGLRLACDMRSDTCSDGRRITTERATPVPCETSPGVWEMVPENTGCYGVRGLESWAQTTSYLSYGAELGLNPPWVPSASVSVAAVESFWRVCGEEPSNQLQNVTSGVDGEPVTASCIVRAATSGRMGIQSAPVAFGGSIVDYNLTSEWQTVSATTTLSGGTQAFARILPSRSGPGCIDAIGCWLTRSDTPGRACWGGEAPVTCAADRHTISTEGWPTTEGEISVTWELAEACPPGVACFVFDGRLSGADVTNPFHIWINSSGNVSIAIHGNSAFASIGQQPAPGVKTTVTARRRDGVLEIYRDGTLVTAKAADPFVWNSEANLGRRYSDATFRSLNGSISSLRVRSTE